MNAFDVLDGLLVLEQSGKGIGEFFTANEVRRIIVYGYGRVGKRAITSIRNAGIDILFAIDKNAENINPKDISVILPQKIPRNDKRIDLIVVTVSDSYYEIRDELEKITDIDIISIGEIVEYCLDGEEII